MAHWWWLSESLDFYFILNGVPKMNTYFGYCKEMNENDSYVLFNMYESRSIGLLKSLESQALTISSVHVMRVYMFMTSSVLMHLESQSRLDSGFNLL